MDLLRLSPSGEKIVWAIGGQLMLSDVVDPRATRSVASGPVWWRFVDSRLAVSHDRRQITWWHWPKLKVSARCLAGGDLITVAELSPDGKKLAVVRRHKVVVYAVETR